jgi:hypothetical protein
MGDRSPRLAVTEVAGFLALGYVRYRRRLALESVRKPVLSAEKPLDDVAPRGRVSLPENQTPETGVTR